MTTVSPNQDDVVSVLKATAKHYRDKPLVQLYGCYGVGVVGDETNGNLLVVVCRPPLENEKQPAGWNVVARAQTTTLTFEQKQKVSQLFGEFADCLVACKHRDIRFDNKHGLNKLVKVRDARTFQGAIVFSTSQGLRSARRTRRYSAFIRHLQQTTKQLQTLLAQENLKHFEGLSLQPNLAYIALTARPDLPADKLLQMLESGEEQPQLQLKQLLTKH